MTGPCRELQERIALDGARGLRDDAVAQEHLAECAECFKALEDAARLDGVLGMMAAAGEPVDAPDAVVKDVIAQVASAPRVVVAPRRFQRHELLAGVAATMLVSAGIYGVISGGQTAFRRSSVPPPPVLEPLGGRGTSSREASLSREQEEELRSLGYLPTKDVDDVKRSASTGNAALDAQLKTLQAKLSQIETEKAKAVQEAQDRVKKEIEYKAKLQGGEVDYRQLAAAQDKARAGAQAAAEAKAAGDRAKVENEKKAAEQHSRAENEIAQRDRTAQTGQDRNLVDQPNQVVQFDRTDVGKKSDEGAAAATSGRTRSYLENDRAVRVGGNIAAPRMLRADVPFVSPELAKRASLRGVVIAEITIGPDGRVTDVKVLRGHPLLDPAAIAHLRSRVYEPPTLNGQPLSTILTVTLRFPEDVTTPSPSPSPSAVSDRAPADAFRAERARVDGLRFLPARGYWSDTYRSGDAPTRALESRLRGLDRRLLPAIDGHEPRLHDAAVSVTQPFDSDPHAALALQLAADRAALEGPGRVLLQVGLAAPPRSGATRPPLRTAVVLDLRGDLPTQTAADLRAVVLALAEARVTGDIFSLVIAGRDAKPVAADAFRHGPLTVAIDGALAAPTGGLTLDDALATAYRAAAGTDDAAELSIRSVLLVTSQPPARDLGALVHCGVQAGIGLSVIASGGATPDHELLAALGHGSARSLASRADAARVVESEIATAGSVVARALRIRIRLAPGVRLVDVIGAHRLDAVETQRVREAEKAVDLRLARTLGVAADRGDDEDGVQIVIPAFHAGRTHVVLLDVVAPGPGALADVSVRYKDLVRLNNGRTDARLQIPAGERVPGAREQNVIANLLALRLGQALTDAASALDRGDTATAAATLTREAALRRSLLADTPDSALQRDVALLDEYRTLVTTSTANWRALLADSLRLAGRLKQQPA